MTINPTTGQIDWTPSGAQIGPVPVTVVVADPQNATATQPYTVTVVDVTPPVVTLDMPAESLPGTVVTSTADAFDNVGVSLVTLELNGTDPVDQPNSPYQRTVNIPADAVAGTEYHVRATAKDAAGNTGTADRTLKVSAVPDTQPPTVTLNAPPQAAPGTTIRVTAAAADNVGVKTITFKADGAPLANDPAHDDQALYAIPQNATVGSSIQFAARVVDFNNNLADASAATVIVAAPDSAPPTVQLTAPPTVPEGGTLALSATAADDIGVAGVEFTVNGVSIGTVNVAPYIASFKLPPATLGGDVLHAKARAFDAAGNEATSPGDTNVLAAPNRPPTADAGGPYAGQSGDLLSLSAALSSDPDPNDQLSYDWDFGDGSTGSGIAPAHPYAVVGAYTAKVTVSDGRGGISTATAPVTVTTATDDTPPSVTLYGPATALPGAQVTMTARATDDHGVVAVTFEINGSNAADTSTEPYQRLVNVPAVASPGDQIAVRATARDAAGNHGSADAMITISAVPDTEPPVVTVNAPPQAAAGSSVHISATAHDNVGVASVSIGVNGGEPTTFASPPYELTYTIPPEAAPGSIVGVVATAVDYTGNQGDATAGITVVTTSEADTTPPTVKLTAPLQILQGKKLPLSADPHDDVGIASVAFFVEGVNVATLTSPPYTVDVDLAPSQGPGTLLKLRAVATDFANLQGSNTAQTLVISTASTGQGVLTGELYDDSTSLPLAGATVTLLGTGANGTGYDQTTTTDARGRWVLRAGEGQGIVRITKSGWTTVDRSAGILVNQAVELFDGRSTRLSEPTSISAVLGGAVSSTNAALNLPAGALTTATDLRLTPLSQQGLQGVVPAGWSPIASADIAPHGVDFTVEGTLSLANSYKVPAARTVVFAQWDEAEGSWRALSTVTVPAAGTALQGIVFSSGQYAFFLPDTAPTAPAIPANGELLGAVPLTALANNAVTTVDPEPRILFYSPGVKTDVRGVISTSTPTSSGLPIEVRLTESYQFLVNGDLQPEQFVEDLFFYQVGGPAVGLGGSLPVTPSQTFEALSLQLGVITVELLAPPLGPRTVTSVGSGGGSASSLSGETLQVPQGALSLPLPISVRGLPTNALGVTLPPGFDLAGAALVTFTGSLAKSAVFSVPKPPAITDASQLRLVRPQELSGQTRLVLVGRATIVGNQILSDTTLPGVPDAFEGVRVPGRYFFIRSAAPFGFVRGTVSAPAGGGFGGALVSKDSYPIVALSAASGAYIEAAPVGAFTLTAVDLQRSDFGSSSGSMPGAGSVVALNIQIATAVPTVTSIAPLDGATNVPLASPVVVRFSRSLDPASVNGTNAGNAKLTVPNGSVVAAVVSLSDKNTLLTLRPTTALDPSTVYAVNLGTGIADQVGRHMTSPFIAHFTSFDTAPPPMPPAGSIQASIPDSTGYTTITATQGTAGVHDTVRVLNLGNKTTYPALVDPNGGFTVKVPAALKDKLQIVITAQNGAQTVADLGRFQNPDGSVAIGPDGGTITLPSGLTLDVPAGAFPDGSIVKFTQLPEAAINVPVTPDYPFVAGFELNSSAAPQRYLNVSFPAPAGVSPTTTGIVAEVVNTYSGPRLSMVDTAKIIDGKLKTSSPPCPGILDKFAHYAVYLNNDAQIAKFGLALLQMAPPRFKSVDIPAVTIDWFSPFVPTGAFTPALTPPLHYEQLYYPASPFINYVSNQGNSVSATAQALFCAENPQEPLCGARTDLGLCMVYPADQVGRIVVHNAATGATISSTPFTAPPAGAAAPIVGAFADPSDTEPPFVVLTTWKPQPPFVLDPGKPVQLLFSEPIQLVSTAAEPDAMYLTNQATPLAKIKGTASANASQARVLTFVSDTPLELGATFVVHMPGVKDFAGNAFVDPTTGPLTFQIFKPHVITPSATVPFTKTDIFSQISTTPLYVGLRDIDFITRAPKETVDHRWHTTLFGVGSQRDSGYQMLAVDASDPENPTATSGIRGGVRNYLHTRALKDLRLNIRSDVAFSDLPTPLQKWTQREYHYAQDDPTIYICADPGDSKISDWKIANQLQHTLAMATGCGDLALTTSYNLNYAILHIYDITDPLHLEAEISQRLLADGGALSGFPRKNWAPSGNGVAKGFDVFPHLDFTHVLKGTEDSATPVTDTNSDTQAAYVAVNGVGLTSVDLGRNLPEVATTDRPKQGGSLIESLGFYSFPYYQDIGIVGEHLVAIASDRTDGTGTNHIETFDAGLTSIAIQPLPIEPNEFVVWKGLNLPTGPGSTMQPHDIALVAGFSPARGQTVGVAAVDVQQNGQLSPIGLVPMPRTVPAGLLSVTFITSRRSRSAGRLLPPIGRPTTTPATPFTGLVVFDLTRIFQGPIDANSDGIDDRIVGFSHGVGLGQQIAAGSMVGFRLDAQRQLDPRGHRRCRQERHRARARDRENV